ncbi:unnamed protein product [Phytophthora lilii]|uniref:Unnamed protein product n=1 Tax=Phytophthora lilii TaxID=2077276 RepID=A0A9W6X9W5_9STRA|nr:unnamed protein product [Phytophthora lilii]
MSLPPVINSPIFNSSYFNTSNGYLTITTGDQRYLRLGGVGTLSASTVIGNLDVGSLSLTLTFDASTGSITDGTGVSTTSATTGILDESVSTNLSVPSGITLGTAQPYKVLSLDGTGSISTITSLTSTIYYGATSNIQFMNTGILSAAINCNAPVFYASALNNTATNQTYQSWSNTLGTPITVDMDINNVSPIFGTVTNHPLRMMTNNSQKLIINSGGNVSIGNSNNTYKLDVAGTTISDILRIRLTTNCPDFVIDAFDGVGVSYNKALRITNPNFVNEFQIQIANADGGDTWVGNVSNTNLRFGTNNTTNMYLTTTGRLGVGTTTPVAPHVSGVANYTITNIATNTYIYNVSNNTWANLGGGPVTISIAAFFNDDIYVQNSVYTSSDRRLKENIKDIDLDIERKKLLKRQVVTITRINLIRLKSA